MNNFTPAETAQRLNEGKIVIFTCRTMLIGWFAVRGLRRKGCRAQLMIHVQKLPVVVADPRR